MTVIVLKHTGPLGLPRGPVLRPGVATDVPDWNIQRHHPVVKQWRDAGILEVEGEEVEAVAPVEPAKPVSKDEDRDALKAEAKELGIVVHYRWSAEKIQEEIDKKLAE